MDSRKVLEGQQEPNSRQRSAGQSRKPFRSAAVLGAGVMGSQIAAHLANAGLQVQLLDMAAAQGSKNALVEGALKKAQKMKPAPFVTAKAAGRIRCGNFDEHFERIAEADWVIEAVVENLDVKRKVMQRIEEAARPDAVITTNTSGLPIRQIASGRSEDFRRRFLGTHFFNPPRYLRLFEVIPTADTDAEVLERVRWFARVHLGKGVVMAKDTPNFIGNRVGVFALNLCMREMTDGDYTIEEVDTLTGPLTGHPRSATFRTADVVGLDTMIQVSQNLFEAVPEDESRHIYRIPDSVKRLVESGAKGAKAGKGFYQKVGRDILSVDLESLEYNPPRPLDLGDMASIASISGLDKRLAALYRDPGRAGGFFRRTSLETLAYAARRIPEIADSPSDIDRAICWGFGWELGPFQIWDAIGFATVLADLRARGIQLPGWVGEMEKSGADSFYQRTDGGIQVYAPAAGFQPAEAPEDEIQLNYIRSDAPKTVWQNQEAALLDLGQGVALYEFRSKANSLGRRVMEGLWEALEIVEDGDWAGLVIGNQGKNFSVGANLKELAELVLQGRFDQVGRAVARFQDTIQRLRYAAKPVVTAMHSQVLGGACEMGMGSSQVVAATETYIGLVELSVGLIPAGTGTTHMTARASESAAQEFASQVQPFLFKAFQAIGTAKVATSAQQAVEAGYLLPSACIVMNAERRLHAARQEVLRLAAQGYSPPPLRNAIYVLGAPGRAALEMMAREMAQSGYATDYDCHLAGRLAWIMAGGDLSGPSHVHEDYLLELEREVFLSLLGEKKTQQRIEHILTKNKPLRN